MFKPLETPAGTPFIGTVAGGLPQVLVRTHHEGDLEAWWFLNGFQWLRADHDDVHIIAQLEAPTT